MARQGRDLEILVARIEQVLAPRGATIRSPDFLEDRITGQKREVDISIRGNIGSAEILIICECRDRSGSQDVTWIEQIAQKRQDVGASKAIAVSSAGFTKPALAKSQFLAIDTRRLDDLTPESIADWFKAGSMTLATYHANVLHVSFDLESDCSETELTEDLKQILTDQGRAFTEKAFRCKTDGQSCSTSDIWSWVHNKQGDLINPTIPVSGERTRKTINANFKNPDQRYQVPLAEGFADIRAIRFVVDIWVSYSEVPIDRISAYSDRESELVQTVQYKFAVADEDYSVDLHRTPEGQITVTANIDPPQV